VRLEGLGKLKISTSSENNKGNKTKRVFFWHMTKSVYNIVTCLLEGEIPEPKDMAVDRQHFHINQIS
jgi:hypothetical protein